MFLQIQNLNAQITAYSQLIADAQDELDIAQFTLNGLNEKHKLREKPRMEVGLAVWTLLIWLVEETIAEIGTSTIHNWCSQANKHSAHNGAIVH